MQVISQIHTFLHVSTLSYHPQGACNQSTESECVCSSTHNQYIPGQHDSSFNLKTVYTATTQTDFMRIVTTKSFSQFYCKWDNFNVLMIYNIEISTTII